MNTHLEQVKNELTGTFLERSVTSWNNNSFAENLKMYRSVFKTVADNLQILLENPALKKHFEVEFHEENELSSLVFYALDDEGESLNYEDYFSMQWNPLTEKMYLELAPNGEVEERKSLELGLNGEEIQAILEQNVAKMFKYSLDKYSNYVFKEKGE